jgi:hypothetical protein
MFSHVFMQRGIALGDPFAGIWFLAEQPSLLRMVRASKRDRLSPDTQWSESEGVIPKIGEMQKDLPGHFRSFSSEAYLDPMNPHPDAHHP